jgi:hypothetical protein
MASENQTTDEYGDPHYGVRLKYAALVVSRQITDGLPRTRLDLQMAAKNLRDNGGVTLSSIAADLIEAALSLKDTQP